MQAGGREVCLQKVVSKLSRPGPAADGQRERRRIDPYRAGEAWEKSEIPDQSVFGRSEFHWSL